MRSVRLTASGACVCWSLCSDCGLLLFLRVRADVAVDEICENDRFRCVCLLVFVQ